MLPVRRRFVAAFFIVLAAIHTALTIHLLATSKTKPWPWIFLSALVYAGLAELLLRLRQDSK